MKTVTLELAKQLKEAGFPQTKPAFSYVAYGKDFKGDEGVSYTNGFESNEFTWVSAPTAEEILDELPAWINFDSDKGTAYLKMSKYEDADYKNPQYQLFYESAYTEYANPLWKVSLVEAAAAIYLYLVKEGLLRKE